jgi:hypothetical protein
MLVGLMSPQLMKSRQRWLSATEKRIEATVRNISSMKVLKLMGMGEDAFQEIQQLRAHEVDMAKYVTRTSVTGSPRLNEIGRTVFLIRS